MHRFSSWIVLIWLTGAGVAVWYTAGHLRMNTDTGDMLSAKLPFRRSYDDYKRHFPQQVDALVVVVDAASPEQADAAAETLAGRLRTQPTLFSDVDLPGAGVFFERNALLYLDPAQLRTLSDRLVSAAPLIGRLQRDPTLRGLAETLTLALQQDAAGPDLDPVFHELARAVDAEASHTAYSVSWQTLFSGNTPDGRGNRRFLLLKPVLDWNDLFAAQRPLDAVREAARDLHLTADRGIRVRITGDLALGYEDLSSALAGSRIGVVLSLVLAAGLLAWGLRSLWLTVASLINLLVGMAMTAAFATLAVSELNLLSVASAVLYVGLGLDYAIHLCFRYRERLSAGLERAAALAAAVRQVRSSLLICALATAAGFYAFLPTSFSAVAQLGLISGTGMFINLVVTLTLLPALLNLMPPPAPDRSLSAAGAAPWYESIPRRHGRPIRLIALVTAVGALLLLPRLSFDRNPLNLRNANSESVALARELMAASDDSGMSITVLAPDADTSASLASALRALPSVREVITLENLLPTATPDKLDVVDELNLLVLPALADHVPLAAPEDVRSELAALKALRDELARHAVATDGTAGADELRQGLDRFLDRLSQETPESSAMAIGTLERSVLASWPINAHRLRLALEPDTAPASIFPDGLRRRWEATDGTRRIAVYPKEDINQSANLRRFVDEVQSVAADATDEPVLTLRAGDAVVRAFQQAMLWATLAITAMLLILMRSVAHTLLVLTPLALAGLLTAGTMVLAGVPFNFANVIALPLLLGAGVDNGVHMVHQYRHGPNAGDNLLGSTTARAVVLTGLTNVTGFSNLLVSPHPGTASMGLVLTVGMIYTLLTTLIVVPALLMRRSGAR